MTGRHPAHHTTNPSVASTIRSPTHHTTPRMRGVRDDNYRFAAAMAQGRRPDPFRTRKRRPGTAMVTPGPIPNPEAKTWHGDGTAFDRMWESSTPPHQHSTKGEGRNTRPSPFFYFQNTHQPAPPCSFFKSIRPPHTVLTVHAPWLDHLTSIQPYCVEFQHQRQLFPSGFTFSPSSIPFIAILRVPSRIPLLEHQISNHRFQRVDCI